MPKDENYKPLIGLMVLAVAALVVATTTFTNVTYWVINATRPPAMKYPGADTAVAEGQYVKVSYYYDSDRGINITRISIIGFTGDPTNYTSVARVCNYYGTTPITAYLVWRGRMGLIRFYEEYIRAFLVGPTIGNNIAGVGFVDSAVYTTAGPYTIYPGQCIDIGAYVVIDPAIPPFLADGRTVLGQYQVDIVMSLQ